MLTIGELASYAGVTVRAVRHYHAKGLLPEPERDRSGYRRYGADAVVELVRIRTLAEAGVPLARVRELLRAGEEEFAAAVAEIDERLRAEIRQRRLHRERIARLAAGDHLALPAEVVEYPPLRGTHRLVLGTDGSTGVEMTAGYGDSRNSSRGGPEWQTKRRSPTSAIPRPSSPGWSTTS
ncbi:helix-turn-helix domain-containing protein [Actinomadura logoneensis]|uniref:helix-turn-helix domain-containing protein n=1 Tax=Actinomadura logoneensis TaxID=2293572 RepID=UPI001F39B1A0|nr:MerR family transcriptional regulator [Actinomadura logoneensis]